MVPCALRATPNPAVERDHPRGTLLVGYGEEFDEGRMRALPAGSTFTEPARHPHFAWAKDWEVVIQVVGHGPSDTTWLRR